MEINEPEDIKLCNTNLDDALEQLGLTEPHSNSEFDILSAPPEDLLDNFLGSVEKDASLCWSKKGGPSGVAGDGSSTSKAKIKVSVKTEKNTSFFHLSDTMKKGLSMLTYPSKPQPRKKGVMSSRTTPASRITIAEALKKANDASKSVVVSHATADQQNVKEKCTSDLQSKSPDTVDDKSNKESQNAMRPLADSDTPKGPTITVKKFDLPVTNERVAEGSGSSAATKESASSNEGRKGCGGAGSATCSPCSYFLENVSQKHNGLLSNREYLAA